jgi:hypothetical protein
MASYADCLGQTVEFDPMKIVGTPNERWQGTDQELLAPRSDHGDD